MTFKEKFDEYFNNCDLGDEWVYSNFIDFILEGLRPEDAFILIPEVAEFLLQQSDEDLRIQLLNLIGSLAGRVNSTEIPKDLVSKLDLIEKIVENDSEYTKSRFNVLKRWYRIG